MGTSSSHDCWAGRARILQVSLAATALILTGIGPGAAVAADVWERPTIPTLQKVIIYLPTSVVMLAALIAATWLRARSAHAGNRGAIGALVVAALPTSVVSTRCFMKEDTVAVRPHVVAGEELARDQISSPVAASDTIKADPHRSCA